MSVYKMFVTESASAAVVTASIDIQKDGVINCITLGVLSVEAGATSIAYTVSAEVSFSGTPAFTTNDIRNSLCQASVRCNPYTTTPAAEIPSIPFCVIPALQVPVSAGERIHLHIQSSTASLDSASAVAYLFVVDGLESRRSDRRR